MNWDFRSFFFLFLPLICGHWLAKCGNESILVYRSLLKTATSQTEPIFSLTSANSLRKLSPLSFLPLASQKLKLKNGFAAVGFSPFRLFSQTNSDGVARVQRVNWKIITYSYLLKLVSPTPKSHHFRDFSSKRTPNQKCVQNFFDRTKAENKQKKNGFFGQNKWSCKRIQWHGKIILNAFFFCFISFVRSTEHQNPFESNRKKINHKNASMREIDANNFVDFWFIISTNASHSIHLQVKRCNKSIAKMMQSDAHRIELIFNIIFETMLPRFDVRVQVKSG